MLFNFKEYIVEKSVKKDERVEILRDNNYIVVAPITEEASCKYGAYTNWCTSAPHSGAWEGVEGKINIPDNNKIVYIIQRNYKMTPENEDKSERFYYLFKDHENGELDDNEEELNEYTELLDDIDSLNFSKIAVEYNFEHKLFNIWSANNINITDLLGYDLFDIPVDQYVKDKIYEFCII